MNRAAIAHRFRSQRYGHARLTWCDVPDRRAVVEHDVVGDDVVIRPDDRVANRGLQRIRRERGGPECSDDVDRQLNGRRDSLGAGIPAGGGTCPGFGGGAFPEPARTRHGILVTVAVLVDAARCEARADRGASSEARDVNEGWRCGRHPTLAASGEDAGKQSHHGEPGECIKSHDVNVVRRQSQYHSRSTKMARIYDRSNWLFYVTRNDLRGRGGLMRRTTELRLTTAISRTAACCAACAGQAPDQRRRRPRQTSRHSRERASSWAMALRPD